MKKAPTRWSPVMEGLLDVKGKAQSHQGNLSSRSLQTVFAEALHIERRMHGINK
jgi:hypothetical protein